MTRMKKNLVAIALASSVVLGTAGVARADDTDASTTTTVPCATTKGKKGKCLSAAQETYKAALEKYKAAKAAIQQDYVKATRAAASAQSRALKAAKKNATAKIAAKLAFSSAMKAAKAAREAAITALGAPPTAPTAP